MLRWLIRPGHVLYMYMYLKPSLDGFKRHEEFLHIGFEAPTRTCIFCHCLINGKFSEGVVSMKAAPSHLLQHITVAADLCVATLYCMCVNTYSYMYLRVISCKINQWRYGSPLRNKKFQLQVVSELWPIKVGVVTPSSAHDSRHWIFCVL